MTNVQELELAKIEPWDNIRTTFDEDKLAELAASMKANGLAQPITVRPVNGRYQIVAGERRTRAARLAGWTKIPAIVRDLTDEEARAIMMTENSARDDLDPIDEAHGYKNAMNDFGWTAQVCADKAGVAVSIVLYRIQLLSLCDELQSMVRDGKVGVGYARAIAAGELTESFQLAAAKALIRRPNSNVMWMTQFVDKLRAEQNNGTQGLALFDLDAFIDQHAPAQDPPHPYQDEPPPPDEALNAYDLILYHARFWHTAAKAWHDLASPYFQRECETAALALEMLAGIRDWPLSDKLRPKRTPAKGQ